MSYHKKNYMKNCLLNFEAFFRLFVFKYKSTHMLSYFVHILSPFSIGMLKYFISIQNKYVDLVSNFF